MIVYRGWRDSEGTLHVTANGRPLPLRLDLENHSPTGFECGYGGSGPAQLALALLAHALARTNKSTADERAVRSHQSYKWAVVAKLPRDKEWRITDETVRQGLKVVLRKTERA